MPLPDMGRPHFIKLLMTWAVAAAFCALQFGFAAYASDPERDPDSPPQASSPNLAELSLEELASIKVETVYGASRREQTTTEAPSSVTLVTQDDIKRQGHRTLADILNSVRGFYVTYDRGYNYIGVRGFNRPGDFGGRILLMVDGHRLNDGVYDTAASGTDFPVDVDLIDRVEVIRGPGSSLYGNNAFFGVINVITRRGRDLDGAELSGSYGGFDTWTGRASYGQRFTNGVEFVVSGTLYRSEGQERLRFPEFVAEDLDGGWARNLFASISYRDFTLQGGVSRREKDWPTAAYDTVPNSHDPRLFTIDERAWADLKFDREFGDAWRLIARGYFDRYQYDGNYPYDYDADVSTRPTVNRDLAVATSAGLDLSVQRTVWETHRMAIGGEWKHDFELIQENWDKNPQEEYLNSDESADVLGVYAQDDWSLRTNLIMNAGVRYDYYSDFGSTLNPRAALIYSPWKPSTVKLLYGHAFRAPNAYELYYAGAGSRANPDLEPETIRSYEVVWEQRLGPRWRTTLSGFWNDVEQLINQDLDPGQDPVSTEDDLVYFNNTGSAVARGVEAEIEGKLSWGLRVLASYTFTDAEDGDTGKDLDNSPQHLGKLALSQSVWREKVFASLELQAMSQRKTVARNVINAFALVNFTLFSRELIKNLEFSGSVYNLFDQHYRHPVSADFYYTGPGSGNSIALDAVEQEGRSFRLKLTYHF